MYDGSHKKINHNIEQTNFYFNLLTNKNILLEVEVGPISGVEDGFGSEKGDYFKLEEAEKMYRFADFHLLALTIGNAHGNYSSLSGIKPKKLDLFKKIDSQIPLVLHGGTGR